MSEEHNDIDWGDLYECLYAFTDRLLKRKHWFRKSSDGSFIKGKQVHDYVTDGIERYLSEPDKFNPTKGSLADYIKFNIIRTLVGNDSISAENKTSLDVLAFAPDEDDDNDSSYLDSMLPYASALFDQQLDYDTIMSHIENEVKGDADVENIYIGISAGLKRREIIEEFNMSTKEFDNGHRRLNTILKNTALKFNLKPLSL